MKKKHGGGCRPKAENEWSGDLARYAKVRENYMAILRLWYDTALLRYSKDADIQMANALTEFLTKRTGTSVLVRETAWHHFRGKVGWVQYQTDVAKQRGEPYLPHDDLLAMLKKGQMHLFESGALAIPDESDDETLVLGGHPRSRLPDLSQESRGIDLARYPAHGRDLIGY